jgi:hypothetical protein
MRDYTPQSALKKVIHVGEVKALSPDVLVVRNGSVGIGTLGAISYLNKKNNSQCACNFRVSL